MDKFIKEETMPYLWFGEGERTAIMETKAEEFRRLAAEDEDRAAKARDYEAKQSWREAARQWRDLADQAERNGW